MTPLQLYLGSIVALCVVAAVVVVAGIRRRAFLRPTTLELATAAVLICLLYVAAIPWQIGLARIPGLDALVFSIPYTTILLIGLRLSPKPGFATLLIFGQGLMGQLLGRGINPAWWPYYLACAACVELVVLFAGNRVKTLPVMLGIGLLRGLLAYSYMYLILAPFLWQQFYAPWYIAMKTSLGLVGCAIGAVLARQIAPAVERASQRASV